MAGGGHKFDIAHRAYLDSGERRSYLDPVRILRALGLPEGSRIADIGTGTGFFAIPAARLVGPRGRVYAVDLSPEMLEDLQAKLVSHPVPNLEAVRSTEARIPLPDASVNVAFLACVLHELDGPGTLLECRRILTRAGRLGIVDWKKEDMEVGPPKAHRLGVSEAEAILEDAGFRPVRRFEAGRYHYGIEARILRA